MRIGITLLLTLILAGCTAFTQNPLVVSLNSLIPHSVPERSDFQPPFQYLRMVLDGRVIFLASVTPDADVSGTTEVWYSAGREVVRLRDGRIVAAVGLRDEWRQVVVPELPGWATLAGHDAPLHWTRTRDVMPGYHFGVQDALALQKVAPPASTELKGLAPQSLIWFEERVEKSSLNVRGYSISVARYALQMKEGQASVIYGEQCLSTALCFSWQRWPVSGSQ